MPSTYSPNLGIELIESGTGAGTWGDSTNNNLLQLDQAIGGSGTITLTSAATSGSPNIIYITEAADRSDLSDGRNAYINFTDDGSLAGADTYVRFEEDTCERMIWITNSMTNGEDLYIMQGTYHVDRTYILANGETALLRFDGGGISSASVINAFAGTVDLSGDVSIGGNIYANGIVYFANSTLTADDEFYASASTAEKPIINFADNALFEYDRTLDKFYLKIDSAVQLEVGADGLKLYANTLDSGAITAPSITLTEDVVIDTEGRGVDFSAVTNTSATGATTDNEVFSAYSEGAWTPVLYDGTTDATMDGNTLGHYTRIGNTVFCRFRCGTSSVAALSSGTLFIRGLPFPAAATINIEGGGTATNGESLNITAGTSLTLLVESNESHMWVFEWDGTSGSSGVTKTQWTDNGVIRGVIQYETDA